MSREEMVALLERERLTGMPRWNVGARARENPAIMGEDRTAPAGNRGLATAQHLEEMSNG